MALKQNAKHLAKALYSVSEQNKVLDSVHSALNTVNDLVKINSQFRAFVQSKRIKSEEKVSILNNVMGEVGHPLVSEIFSFLKGNQAANIFRDVTSLFNRRYNHGKNIVSVKGTVASSITEDEKSSLKSSLDLILGKNTDLVINVDEALIGGIRLRIENTYLDASVQSQLQTLRGELLQL
jgi:F-type H+-transporting ATPase subunit delta